MGSFDFGSGLSDLWGGITGQTAADAAKSASYASVAAQREALEYLKQINEVPQAYREQALNVLGTAFGLSPVQTAQTATSGQSEASKKAAQRSMALQYSPWKNNMAPIATGTGTDGVVPQDNVVESQPVMPQLGFQEMAESSPFYKALMAGSEEAVLRNAGATGGLRSGNVQTSLSGNQNKALLSYLSGLQGFTNLDGGSTNIANTISGIGSTQAAGITASAQAKTNALQNLMNMGFLAAII